MHPLALTVVFTAGSNADVIRSRPRGLAGEALKPQTNDRPQNPGSRCLLHQLCERLELGLHLFQLLPWENPETEKRISCACRSIASWIFNPWNLRNVIFSPQHLLILVLDVQTFLKCGLELFCFCVFVAGHGMTLWNSTPLSRRP